jgi:precorrin-6A/cobalt-precorrin-6A reductase
VKRVLILGGTGDAVQLAAEAAKLPYIEVISSLAGRTQQAIAPLGQVRVGGFGGTDGLIAYLQQQRIDGLIDATHPFAAQMSHQAAAAATACGIPRLLLLRPAWQPMAGDRWIEVESHTAAAERLPSLAQRVFLTIGRQELAAFAHLTQLWFLMRMIDPPRPAVPPGLVLLERGPFSLEHEQALLEQHQIGAIVSKNSGGAATYAKLIAARDLQIPVVMVQRPTLPAGDRVEAVEGAISWLQEVVGGAHPTGDGS